MYVHCRPTTVKEQKESVIAQEQRQMHRAASVFFQLPKQSHPTRWNSGSRKSLFSLPDKATSTGYSTVPHKTCHNSTTLPAFTTKSSTHLTDTPVSRQAKDPTKSSPLTPRALHFSGPHHTKTYKRLNSVTTNVLSRRLGVQVKQT